MGRPPPCHGRWLPGYGCVHTNTSVWKNLRRFQNESFAVEQATLPTPPTRWTNSSELAQWLFHHFNTLVPSASRFAVAIESDYYVPLALLGDSIFEGIRGTRIGLRHHHYKALPNATLLGLREWHNQSFLPPYVGATSGSATQHLLWQLNNTHAPLLPASLRNQPRLVIALLIGTNNLGLGQPAEEAAAGVLTIAHWLLSQTSCRMLIVCGLLPAAPRRGRAPMGAPGSHDAWSRVINSTNAKILRGMPTLSLSGSTDWRDGGSVIGSGSNARTSCASRRACFVDCGSAFRTAMGVNLSLMTDGMHPNEAGMQILGECIGSAIISSEGGAVGVR